MIPSWRNRLRLTPEQLRQQKWFALFGDRLLAPALWQSSPRALCGACAAGLFAAWIPLPMHSLVAVGLALLFGFNLPLALLAVWFNNPLTLPLMYLWAYRTGCALLHQPPSPFTQNGPWPGSSRRRRACCLPSCSAACCSACSAPCWGPSSAP